MLSHQSTREALGYIIEKDGVRGLYAGLSSGLFGTAANNFSYFFYYSWLRDVFNPKTVASELLVGAGAGALSQLTTLPLSVAITRQQTAPSHLRTNLVSTCVNIVQEDGWTGLYRGLGPSMILVSNPAITYGVYERIKTWLTSGRKGNLTSLEVFCMGALAKSLATVITYPYILAKSRLQWKPPKELMEQDAKIHYKTALDVLRHVWEMEGPKGLYRGLNAQIAKAVFSQALLFLIKEKIDKYTMLLFILSRSGKLFRRGRPSP
jgi:hypothetical protein